MVQTWTYGDSGRDLQDAKAFAIKYGYFVYRLGNGQYMVSRSQIVEVM